ncbi:hypothetical protein B296_00019925 [Ensete ventricosum]|uniref:Uncharacterized protein n=1 Tax=Ensete ventricosum TaxID=4639 RepID=A0A426YUD1_ENSVE|nr:hypothetical protein B296_00019925 [Ensete ventricosum]
MSSSCGTDTCRCIPLPLSSMACDVPHQLVEVGVLISRLRHVSRQFIVGRPPRRLPLVATDNVTGSGNLTPARVRDVTDSLSLADGKILAVEGLAAICKPFSHPLPLSVPGNLTRLRRAQGHLLVARSMREPCACGTERFFFAFCASS